MNLKSHHSHPRRPPWTSWSGLRPHRKLLKCGVHEEGTPLKNSTTRTRIGVSGHLISMNDTHQLSTLGLGDMAVSNTIGSNVFDILVGLGIPWGLQTMVINYGSTVSSSPRLISHRDTRHKLLMGMDSGIGPVPAESPHGTHCPPLLGTLAPIFHEGLWNGLRGTCPGKPHVQPPHTCAHGHARPLLMCSLTRSGDLNPRLANRPPLCAPHEHPPMLSRRNTLGCPRLSGQGPEQPRYSGHMCLFFSGEDQQPGSGLFRRAVAGLCRSHSESFWFWNCPLFHLILPRHLQSL